VATILYKNLDLKLKYYLFILFEHEYYMTRISFDNQFIERGSRLFMLNYFITENRLRGERWMFL